MSPSSNSCATIANAQKTVQRSLAKVVFQLSPSSSSGAILVHDQKTVQRSLASVVFQVSPSSNSGTILAHAQKTVQGVIAHGPTIFKIGITADPSHRWGNHKYGYQHDRNAYQQMLIFSEADSAGAAMLEASLINTFKSQAGCRNTAPGGEGVRHGCVIYTYIVYRHL